LLDFTNQLVVHLALSERGLSLEVQQLRIGAGRACRLYMQMVRRAPHNHMPLAHRLMAPSV
jgi:hypothetical protein